MWQHLYNWFLYPHRIAAVRRFLPHPPRILDVGCGNHGPKTTRRYLPDAVYHGLDHGRWNRDTEDDRCMDAFYEVDLNQPGALDGVPAASYDVVFCSHVLEHLASPYSVARALVTKLVPGGILYVETPSERSLRLPRAHDGWGIVRGCLNFYDDDTHRSWVDLRRVAGDLAAEGCEVHGPHLRWLARRILGLPLYVVATLLVKGFVPASVLWDVTGFAEWLIAVRRSAPDSPNGIPPVARQDSSEPRKPPARTENSGRRPGPRVPVCVGVAALSRPPSPRRGLLRHRAPPYRAGGGRGGLWARGRLLPLRPNG